MIDVSACQFYVKNSIPEQTMFTKGIMKERILKYLSNKNEFLYQSLLASLISLETFYEKCNKFTFKASKYQPLIKKIPFKRRN